MVVNVSYKEEGLVAIHAPRVHSDPKRMIELIWPWSCHTRCAYRAHMGPRVRIHHLHAVIASVTHIQQVALTRARRAHS